MSVSIEFSCVIKCAIDIFGTKMIFDYSCLPSCMKFVSTDGARTALNLGGTMLGYYPVRVLPSKTAILPVNPTFLPRV